MKIETSLIAVDDLIKLVNLALLTGRLKNGHLVSMLLVGDIETGKTQILEVFMQLPTVIWANDLSAHVIVDEVAPEVEKGKTHIVIPDLLKVLGHQKTVTRNTITMLNSIMEEGLKNVMFYGTRKEFREPVKCGVIAAMTKDAYKAREPHWKNIGFVSRCIPVSFSYSEQTRLRIHDHIRNGFPQKIVEVMMGELTSIEIPPDIGMRVQELAVGTIPFSTGFRLHKQLRSLLQAEALYNQRTIATTADLEEVTRLSSFMNLGYNPI